MKRIGLALAFCLSLILSAHAQGGMGPGPGTVHSTGGGGYTGPGDVVSGAVAFYSCRAYSAATVGTKAYRIVRASDSAQTDINSLASGLCDTSTPATFCAATTCKIVTWYDQSGALACGAAACDTTQSNNAKRADLTLSAQNGWPCGTSSGSASGVEMVNATGFTLSQPLTLSAVAIRTGNTTTLGRIITQSANVASRFSYSAAVNQVTTGGGGTVTATASDSAYHAFVVVFNGASSNVVVDGAATSGNTGATGWSSNIDLMGDSSSTQAMTGNLCEAAIWNSAFNATQYGNMNTNMHSAANGWNF